MSEAPFVLWPPAVLLKVALDLLVSVGVSHEDAAYIAASMVESDLAGHESHGMRRLPEYLARCAEGKTDPRAHGVVELDGGAVVRIDGQLGFGHVVMRDAAVLAVDRARANGVSVVAVRRSSHAGRFAGYCEWAASEGVIMLFFANNSGGAQEVAPPGGLHPRLATNPIAVGIPRAKSPHLVLDMSTSVVAAGRLAEWRDRGEVVPEEWLNEAGAMRSLGGVKGFGLSLMVEALAGVLTSSGSVSQEANRDDQGALIVALDPTRLRALPAFTAEVEHFIAYVRAVPLEKGADPVRMPGEAGAATAAERREHGIPVQDFTRRALVTLCDERGISLPEIGVRPNRAPRS